VGDAIRRKCHAIHPARLPYENAEFAEIGRWSPRIVEFIGPHRRRRATAGQTEPGGKGPRRRRPRRAGSEGLMRKVAKVSGLAVRIGYPVLIKAAAGGGGRGMPAVPRRRSLATGLARPDRRPSWPSRTEASTSRSTSMPRHVEVQLLGDRRQRRARGGDCVAAAAPKLVEESPAPNLARRGAAGPS